MGWGMEIFGLESADEWLCRKDTSFSCMACQYRAYAVHHHDLPHVMSKCGVGNWVGKWVLGGGMVGMTGCPSIIV